MLPQFQQNPSQDYYEFNNEAANMNLTERCNAVQNINEFAQSRLQSSDLDEEQQPYVSCVQTGAHAALMQDTDHLHMPQ